MVRSEEQLPETSLWRNQANRFNLIAVMYLWSSSNFIGYLLMFFTKYFQGDFIVNYAVCGLSDTLSMVYIWFLRRKLSLKPMLNTCVACIVTLSLVLNFTMVPSSDMSANLTATSVLLFFIRLNCVAIQNYGYEINQVLFPVLIRGTVFSISNLVSRPFAAVGTIVTEYTDKPIYFVIGAAIGMFVFVKIINEPTK